METNDIFAFVVVGAILIAAAIPVGGIIFARKNKGVKEDDTAKKPETPQRSQPVLREEW